MRRTFVLACALACTLAGLAAHALPARGDDEGTGERIAWFTSLTDARKAAAETGRPMFVALHVRPRVASPAATARTTRWLKAYRNPDLVAVARDLVCVLRVTSAPEGSDPDVDRGAPAAVHLVVDATSRVLARLDADLPPATGVLERLLRRGLRVHGPIDPEAPRIDAAAISRAKQRIDGMSPMKPVGVHTEAPGVRLRLRWEMPMPALRGEDDAPLRALVSMRWDGAGPFPLGGFEAAPGALVDHPLDVRFDALPGLAALATPGLHRVDLYLAPDVGGFPFSRGPLHVGRVWIELGDGGDGGGAGEQPQPDPQPKPDEDQQPDPADEGGSEPPPVAPDQAQDDVVDPFVGEGETVKKDDAIVAVEDDDAAVKPPQRVPLSEALRTFEKEREAAIRSEDITPGERAFLRRYFALLEKHAGGPDARAPGKAPAKDADRDPKKAPKKAPGDGR